MLRGDISNRAAAIIAVDYRILIDEQRPYLWLAQRVPDLLLSKGFEASMNRALPWRPGARLWVEAFPEYRIAAFTVGVPIISRAIEMILGSHIAEVYHFDNRHEFRNWSKITGAIGRIYTNDPQLLGLDEIIQPHSGWSQEI